METNESLNQKFYNILDKNEFIIYQLSRFLIKSKEYNFKPFIFDFYENIKVKVSPLNIIIGEYDENGFKTEKSLYFKIGLHDIKRNSDFINLNESQIRDIRLKLDLLNINFKFILSEILINMVQNEYKKIVYNYKLKFATVINVVKSYFHRGEILLATTYKLVLHDRDESFKR